MWNLIEIHHQVLKMKHAARHDAVLSHNLRPDFQEYIPSSSFPLLSVTTKQLSKSHSHRLCKMSFIGGIACYMFPLIKPSSGNIH
jgi:hypothetical protein